MVTAEPLGRCRHAPLLRSACPLERPQPRPGVARNAPAAA